MGTLAPPHIRPRLSRRTSHFVLPEQWASMRKAEALERKTGHRIIHFEKGDFQGEEFRPAPHIMEAAAPRPSPRATCATCRAPACRSCARRSPKRPANAAARDP